MHKLPALLLLTACGAVASERDYLIDIPQVTAASGLAQALTDAPAAMTILDREIIVASGARNLPELLRLVPGFQTARVDANKYATTYHGMADDFPNRLEIRVDGRSVYLPLLSAVDWASLGIALEEIERIEVVRGSNTPTEGTNAFNGSVNILTRSPLITDGVSYSAQIGKRGTQTHHVAGSGDAGLARYRINTGYERDDGASRFDDGSDNQYLNFSLVRPLHLQHTLTLSAGIDEGAIDSSTDYGFARFHGEREHRSHYESLLLESLYSDTGTLKLSAWQQYVDLRTPYATDDELRLFFPPFNRTPASLLPAFRELNQGLRPVAEHGTGIIRDAELRLSEELDPLTLSGGLGWRYQQTESDLLLQQGPVNEDRWRLFGNLEWRPAHDWTLNTGAMFESTDVGADALGVRQAVNYKPTPHASVRLAWSHSERLPSLLEQNQNARFLLPALPPYTSEPQVLLVDSHQLDPLGAEQNETWELGYHQRLGGRDFIDLRLFHERISDAVISARRPVSTADLDGMELVDLGLLTGIPALSSANQWVRYRINGAAWTTQGLEAQLHLQPADSVWALLGYAYADAEINHSLPPGIQEVVPRHTASLLLNWAPQPDLSLSLIHYHISAMDWLQNDRTHQPSMKRTDLRLSKTSSVSGYTIQTALLLESVFDSDWSEYSVDNEYAGGVYLQFRLQHR